MQGTRWACRWECWNRRMRCHKACLWTKLDVQQKSLAITYTGACTWHAQNGVPNICRIPPSFPQAKLSQQAVALSGVNHLRKTYDAHWKEDLSYFMYFIHALRLTQSVPLKIIAISYIFYPKMFQTRRKSSFPYKVSGHSSSIFDLLSPIPLVPGIRHDTRHGRACGFNSSFVTS